MGSNGPTWGNRSMRHQLACDEAIRARQEANRLCVRAWNIGLDQGVATIQPSPTIFMAIDGGFPFLRVKCSACRTFGFVDLREVKRPENTKIWQLEGMLACGRCRGDWRRPPRAVIDRLTASKTAAGWTEPPQRFKVVPMTTNRPTYGGRELTDDDLARIRASIEGFDTIDVIDDDMRALIEAHMPDLAHKLPPRPRG